MQGWGRAAATGCSIGASILSAHCCCCCIICLSPPTANMLLRIDDIVSGISKRQGGGGGGGGPSGPQVDDHENVDTEAMLPE